MPHTSRKTVYLALADFLIPESGKMCRFSEVCTFEDALAALDFRVDLKEGFSRALASDASGGSEAQLEALNSADPTAFTALTTVTIATYYMNPEVRRRIGYPGQENVPYDSKATQFYLTDGSLGKVIARGRKYRPTPGL